MQKKGEYYEDIDEKEEGEKNPFNYLLSLRMDNYTEDGLQKLDDEIIKLKDMIKKLEKMKPKDLWLDDLGELEEQLKSIKIEKKKK